MNKNLKGDELWELILKKGKEKEQLVNAIEINLEEGVRTFINHERRQEAYVHESSKKNGTYQFSFFDQYGPVGDFEGNNFQLVATKVVEYGFTPCKEEDFQYSTLSLNQAPTTSIQGLNKFDEYDILMDIENHIDNLLYEDDDLEITKIGLFGSRISNEANDFSDLDIVIEYTGSMREDDLYDVLNEEPLIIGDIQIDFSPYSIDKGNSISNYEQLNSIILLYENGDFKLQSKRKINEIGYDM